MKSILAIALLTLSVSAHALTKEEYASEIAATTQMMGQTKMQLPEGTITIIEAKARKATVMFKAVGDLSREAFVSVGAMTVQAFCSDIEYRKFIRAGGEMKYIYYGLDNTLVYAETINNTACNAIGIP